MHLRRGLLRKRLPSDGLDGDHCDPCRRRHRHWHDHLPVVTHGQPTPATSGLARAPAEGTPVCVRGRYCRRKRRELANEKKENEKLRKDLEAFKGSVVGVRAVSADYDPRVEGDDHGIDELAKESSCGDDLAKRDRRRKQEAAFELAEISSVSEDMSMPPFELARWFWREEAGLVHKHNPNDVLEGCFISYSGSVSYEISQAYHNYQHKNGPPEMVVDLTGE